MAQRGLNNNTGNISDIYNLNNATNLVVASLPTKTDVNTSIATNNLNYTTTSGINTLLTNTVAQQILDRNTAVALAITNNNANYTATLLLATLINNNIIANNLLYTSTINLNLLLANAVTSRDAAISTAISGANTYSTAYTNTKISTEIVRADASIATNIATNDLNNLALAKSYTAKQTFTDIDLTGKLNFTSVGDSTIQYGYGAIGILASSIGQMNSICCGHNTKNSGTYSVSIGAYALAYQNCVCLGYDSATRSNVNNVNNTYLGFSSNIVAGTTYSNSSCIGHASEITASNQVKLGNSTSTTESANLNCTTNLTGTNITSTNLSATTITTSNLISNGIITYNYSTNPLWTSFKNNGFSTIITNIKSISAYDITNSLNSITLPCGIYMINYSITANYSINTALYWMNCGISLSATSTFDIQANKSYCSSNTSTQFNISNSFCYTSTGNIVYLNCLLNVMKEVLP